MARFFTSDWHLNSTAIIQYSKRPFKNGEKMASAYIRSCNSQAKMSNDVVFCVGDFYLRGDDRHGLGDQGLKIPSKEYLAQIKPMFFMLEGNHDLNNFGKVHAKMLTLDLGQFKNTTVSHYPSYDTRSTISFLKYKTLHIHLCGHVHNKWKFKYIKTSNVLNVNVGVDVWNHRIVSEKKLLGEIQSYVATQLNIKR